MTLRFEEHVPPREAVLALYRSVGWTAYLEEPDRLMRGLEGSHVIAAYVDETLVGLARAVSDGATVWLLQDLLVDPGWQGRGIGAQLLRRQRDHHADLIRGLLTTDEDGPVELYERCGWRREPRLVTLMSGR